MGSSQINPSFQVIMKNGIMGSHSVVKLEPMDKNRVKMSIFHQNPFFDPHVRACSQHEVIQTIFFTMVRIMTNTYVMASHGG